MALSQGTRVGPYEILAQGRTTEGQTLLEPVCASLPDAKDTLDFVSAEALLKTLIEVTA
jgi:hypothetical protein